MNTEAFFQEDFGAINSKSIWKTPRCRLVVALCVTELFPAKSVEIEYLFSFLAPQPSVPKMWHGNSEACVPQCHHRSGVWGANPDPPKSQGFLAVHHFPCQDLTLAPSISSSSMDFYSKAKLHFRKFHVHSFYGGCLTSLRPSALKGLKMFE